MFCNILNIFTVTFDQFNASLLTFLSNLSDPTLLNSCVQNVNCISLIFTGSIICWLFPLHSSPPSVGGISYSALPDYNV